MVETAADARNEAFEARWDIRPVDCVQVEWRALYLGHIVPDEQPYSDILAGALKVRMPVDPAG